MKVVVKDDKVFVVCFEESLDAVEEGEGAMPDFFEDCLEEDDGWVESG